jgi:hypothetical protein
MPQGPTPSSQNRPAEDLHHVDRVEHKADNYQDNSEIKNASEGFGMNAKTEVLGMDESAETNDKVSEILSHGKEQKGSGSGTASATSASKKDIETLRAQLLKNLPSEKVMRRQVEGEIKNEIKYLRRRAMGLIRPPYGSMSYFEMANLLKKIRELKGLLYSLVKISMERLKTLWLRFVHGIM